MLAQKRRNGPRTLHCQSFIRLQAVSLQDAVKKKEGSGEPQLKEEGETSNGEGRGKKRSAIILLATRWENFTSSGKGRGRGHVIGGEGILNYSHHYQNVGK